MGETWPADIFVWSSSIHKKCEFVVNILLSANYM